MANRKKDRPVPPCPGDPENYVLVRTKEGPHWRKKRGTDKPAKLNAAFKNNVKVTRLISPVASALRKKLRPFLDRLNTGRFVAHVSGLLKKEYNKTGKIDFMPLKGYDLQPDYPLGYLLDRDYFVHTKNGEVIIEISLDERSVAALNKQVTAYFFEIILLYGDLLKPDGLRIDSDTSPLYDIKLKTATKCRLSLILPAKKVSWMVILKLSCMEGKELARHSRHYGMRVVWAERI